MWEEKAVVDQLVFEEVQQSYGRAVSSKKLFQRFYDILLNASPAIAAKFTKTDFIKQYELLEHSLTMALLFAQDNGIAKSAIDRIRHSHSHAHLDINPKWYELWLDSLMQAVSETDPKFNDALEKKWRQCLVGALDYIKAGY